MNRVWGIGLSRTGTTSLHRALTILGYRSVHYPRSLSRARRYEAACDTPVATQYELLDREYPDSRFIFTVRESEGWLRSMQYLMGENRLDRWTWFKSPQVVAAHRELYGTLGFDRERMLEGYGRHREQVMDYFRNGRSGRLLVLDICSGEGWEKLCPFLDQPIPDEPFPHTNKGR